MQDYLSSFEFDRILDGIEKNGVTPMNQLKAEIEREINDITTSVPEDIKKNPRFMFVIDSISGLMQTICQRIEETYIHAEREDIIQAYSSGWHDGQWHTMEKYKNIEYDYTGGETAGNAYYSETYKETKLLK